MKATVAAVMIGGALVGPIALAGAQPGATEAAADAAFLYLL